MRSRRLIVDRAWITILWAAVLLIGLIGQAAADRLDGFNVVAMPGHPFGSTSAHQALLAARRLGARAIAIIPFLWQPDPSSARLDHGADMSDEELRTAIREAHSLGFWVIVKPHVWVPGSWAGAIAPKTEANWRLWFARYRREICRIAHIAAEEGADVMVIGTELSKTSQRPEWIGVIAAVRAIFPRTVTYVAHDLAEAEAVPFWNLLDEIGVTLYPPLGRDDDRAGRLAIMRDVANRLDKLAERYHKPVLVAEIGLRSAVGAAAKPWQSAEERVAKPDPRLQAEVLADWLSALNRPFIRGVLIWRWLTDPSAGGPADTDFTVQGKPAERILHCAWVTACETH